MRKLLYIGGVLIVVLAAGYFIVQALIRKGNKTGILKIVRLHCTVKPLINHQGEGDPDHITSLRKALMGSGSVRAITRMPLHKGGAYRVEGAFHDLDVTTLNPFGREPG
jgi:hypothetical protein